MNFEIGHLVDHHRLGKGVILGLDDNRITGYPMCVNFDGHLAWFTVEGKSNIYDYSASLVRDYSIKSLFEFQKK